MIKNNFSAYLSHRCWLALTINLQLGLGVCWCMARVWHCTIIARARGLPYTFPKAFKQCLCSSGWAHLVSTLALMRRYPPPDGGGCSGGAGDVPPGVPAGPPGVPGLAGGGAGEAELLYPAGGRCGHAGGDAPEAAGLKLITFLSPYYLFFSFLLFHFLQFRFFIYFLYCQGK